MTRKALSLAVLIPLVLTLSACPKKPAQTTDDMTTKNVPVTTPPKTDPVSPPAVSAPVEDPMAAMLSGDLAQVNERVRAQGLLGDVYFDYDKSDLRDEARQRLSKNAEFLLANRQFQVTIEGHSDERGTNDYNLALGERRAAAAREYLAQLGVPATRVRTISYGEERPFCSDSAESCWGQNRRGHFVITGRE
jgi:peptidoglycan-associated lipoprotein